MGNFVGSIIEQQESTRADIHALKEAIEQLRAEVAANTKSLRKIEDFQATQDECEARQMTIAEDVTRIANSVVGLVEDMHTQNRMLTSLLDGLAQRVTAEHTLADLVERMRNEPS